MMLFPSMMLFTIFFFVLQLASTSSIDTKTCYRPNGEESRHLDKKADLVPCDRTAEVSSCCSEVDLCMGNGLCQDMVADNKFSVQGCTDPGWSEPCAQIGLRPSNGYVYLSQCASGSVSAYCEGEQPCCNDEKNYKIYPQFDHPHLAGDESYESPGEISHVDDNNNNNNNNQSSWSASNIASLIVEIFAAVAGFLGLIVASRTLAGYVKRLVTRIKSWWSDQQLQRRESQYGTQYELDGSRVLEQYSDFPALNEVRAYNVTELPV